MTAAPRPGHGSGVDATPDLLRTTLGAAAAEAAVRGWPVLLLGPDGKQPLHVPALQEHAWRSATTDIVDLERRFATAGARCQGIGIVTGEVPGDDPGCGPVVLDLDGPCAVAWGQAHFAAELTAGTVPWAETAHGAHLYFAADPAITRAVKVPAPGFGCSCGSEKPCGIDILGAGGYAAMAPSAGKQWVLHPQVVAPPPFPADLRGLSRPGLPPAESWGTGLEPGVLRVVEALHIHGITARHTNTGVWSYCCPAHDDHTASAATGHSSDRPTAWVHCRAGCASGDILAQLGLTWRDLLDDPTGPRGPGGGRTWGPTSAAARQARADALAGQLASTPTPSLDPAQLGQAEAQLRAALADPNPLRLVVATPGLGKSHLAAEAESGVGWSRVVVPTHRLAGERRDMWAAAGADPADTWVHQGRRPPTADEVASIEAARAAGTISEVKLGAGTCLHIAAVGEVTTANHFAVRVCASGCPEGRAAGYRAALAARDFRRADEIRAEMAADGLDVLDIVPCGAIPQFAAEKTTPLLAIAGSAIAPSQLSSPRGVPTPQLVVDEVPAFATPTRVGPANVAGWEEQWGGHLAWLLDRCDRAKAAGDTDGEAAWTALIEAHEQMVEQVTPVFDRLRTELVGRGGRPPSRGRLTRIAKRLGHLAAEHEHRRTGLPAWERVRVEWSGARLDELEAPLRGAEALAWAARHGTLTVEKIEKTETITWRAVAWSPNSLGQTVLDRHARGDETTLLDATPSPGVTAMVTAMGGTVTRVVVPSPVRFLANGSAMLGRGLRRDQARRAAWAVKLIDEHRSALAAAEGCAPEAIAVLTHKPWAEACIAAGLAGDRIGWWGRDDRGHNDWADAPALLIAGPPTLPPHALRNEYAVDRTRALAGGDLPASWPQWSADTPMSIGHVYHSGGGQETWPGLLPDDPRLRQWTLARYAGLIVQATGRLRSVRRPGERGAAVLMLGPCPDLGGYGITVHRADATAPIALAPTAADRGAVRQAEGVLRVLAALDGLGEVATERQIQSWWRALGQPAPHHRVIRRTRDYLAAGESLAELRRRMTDLVGAALADGVVHSLRPDHLPQTLREIVMASTAAATARRPITITTAVRVPARRLATRGGLRAHAPPAISA
ncbi:MAG: bifunctional DNA primase/polymerase [Acidimicrobiales bacterium]